MAADDRTRHSSPTDRGFPNGAGCLRSQRGRPPVHLLSMQSSATGDRINRVWASVETGADLDAMLGDPDAVDVKGPRWWMLRSESLEILPTGTWRVMATLTPGHRRPGRAALRDRPQGEPPQPASDERTGGAGSTAFGTGKRAWIFGPKIQLDLAVHATRVEPAPALRGRKGTSTTSLPG
jgi:hypothetical protein